MVTLPPGHKDVEEYAKALLTFIHEPLSTQITGGIHVNDAFIHDAWSLLPSAWTSFWISLPSPQIAQKDLINALRKDDDAARVEELPGRPESLSLWLERIRSMSLDREQIVLPEDMEEVELEESFTGRMVTKKLAEVRVAARYINHVCKVSGVKRVVDIGSGQGYLATTLASVCGLKVLAIDGSSKQIEGSKTAATQAGLTEGSEITHLVRYVDGSGSLTSEIEDWAHGEACLLTGLHACGSLSEHMLRLFQSTSCISRLAVVGCCYNHITPLSPSTPNGFPISNFMRDNELKLSTSALITGCQAPTNWTHNPDSLFARKHFYRAVLEKLLWDKGLSALGSARPVWGIRNGDLKSFDKYAERAIKSLGLELGKDVTVEEIREYERRYEDRAHETAILWTLSVLLCRIVESIIVLDRWFWLREGGASEVGVLPLFDYGISPRNMMIVARK